MGYVESLLAREEEIAFATRQHFIVMASRILSYGLLLAAIGLATFFAYRYTDGDRRTLIGFLLAIPFLIGFLGEFLGWSSREYIVTNRRVIQTDGVINKRVSDSSLDKVNDVVLVQSAMGRLMDYGDIEIITGSDMGTNIFRQIAQPVTFKTAMLNEKEGLRDLMSSRGRGGNTLGDDEPASVMDIPLLIAHLAELRDRGLLSPEEFERKKADLLERL